MLALHDPDELRVLTEGTADVFAALCDDSGRELHRRHLFRMDQMEAILGFPHKTGQRHIRFYLQPSLDAAFEVSSLRAVMDPSADPTARIVQIFYLINWCQSLTENLKCPEALSSAGLHSEEDYESDYEAKLQQFHQAISSHLLQWFDHWRTGQADALEERHRLDEGMVKAGIHSLARAAGLPVREPIKAPPSEAVKVAFRAVLQQLGIPHSFEDLSLDERIDPVPLLSERARVGYRKVRLPPRWHRSDNGPFLAFLADSGQPVALLPEKPGHYRVIDPVEGTSKPFSTAQSPKLAPMAYSFYPTLPDSPLSFAQIFHFLRHKIPSRDVVAVIGYAFLAGFLSLLIPLLTGRIFDIAIPTANRGMLHQFTFGLLACAFATAAFQITQAFAQTRFQASALGTLQAAVFHRMLHLPTTFFRRFNAGRLANRVMDVSNLQPYLENHLFQILLLAVFAGFSLLILFFFSWQMATVAILVIAIFSAAAAALYWRLIRRERHRMDRNITAKCLQFLIGLSKIRVAGAENRAFLRWARDYAHRQEATRHSLLMGSRLILITVALPVLTMASVYMVAFHLLTTQTAAPANLSFGHFIAFNAALTNVLNSIVAITAFAVPAAEVVPTMQRLQPLLREQPESGHAGRVPVTLKGGIEISHLRYRYAPDEPMVLRDLSVTVKQGEFHAVVGPSGSGKSTLFRLLLGFDSPEKGDIFFDGKSLGSIDLQYFRRQLGVVLQHSRVMPGSLYENIAGASGMSLDEAMEAARLAALDEDIRAMPMGLHTVVNQDATTLSGGQRQRLLIAAAIARQPKIFLMDEATSALDNRSQAAVSESLQSLKVTRLVVAHRLSTIRHADQIHVLDQGRLVESGSYEDLIRKDSLFANLAQRQTA